MKTTLKTLLLSLALMTSFSLAHADDDEDFAGMMPGQGYGMMGGYGSGMGGMRGQGMGYGGMMPGYGMGMGMRGQGMGIIQLSDEQMKKMQQVRANAMKDMQPIMRKMWKARAALWKAMRTDKRDHKAIGKAYDAMASVKKEAFMQRLKMQEEMRKVLTKEQREELKDAYESMMMGN
ncbi:periplasmic heavy metal sensor [Hydrogenovibrio sp. JE_KL2]|uniref:periplasmic heavy metal sensor n=1 Tax=Hydrogenovibrio sp. JE_KL2 TaxID=2651188 RepID=UPI001562C131|nr:periplasmic heavy metal sensor [Hydrogenovibrio sp. JE_KL2]